MKKMKKNCILLMLIFLGLNNVTNAQNVNIPDANFKAALVANTAINTNGDAEIQVSEASAFTDTIDVSSSGINNLTGIEAFTVIHKLYCYNNYLTSLNVSANTALIDLNCYNDHLTSLNVSANTALTLLNCGKNQLTSLNVSANTALTFLGCYINQLTSLILPSSTALTTLNCDQNQLTSLNVSGCTALTYLGCGSNQLTSLNVSANTALTALGCSSNQLTNLNVSANTTITNLGCYENLLTNLNVSANTALISLSCFNNQLTSLNVKNGNNTNLVNFNATNNPNLSCIQVDNATYMNAHWAGYKDVTASYNTNCGSAGSCFAYYSTVYDSLLNTFVVTVDSLSTAMAASYHWDFGDGFTSTLPTPQHYYNTDSVYNVCMKIFTPAGDSCTYCHLIGIDTLGAIMRNGGFTLDIKNVNSVGISTSSLTDTRITVFPNPSNSYINIIFSENQKQTTVKIIDVLGKEIGIWKIENTNKLELKKGEMKTGIYFIQIINENKSVVNKKIIIQ
jgi:hypothetical protein